MAGKSSVVHTIHLPMTISIEDRELNIRKITCGIPNPNFPGPGKVLMLVGATGSGKSTLINGFVNYIMGVQYEDDHRYKLIDNEGAGSQAHSQTKWITAYTFYKEKKLPYTMTIIDTPGFGDTEGLERDKQITKQIKEFFSMKGVQGIDQLHGIGFVVKAPNSRLTPTQRYIFDSILGIFGKDIAKNIFVVLTFADGKKPQALSAIKEAKLGFQKSFKFNNSALLPRDHDHGDDDDTEDGFNLLFWKMGEKSFQDFFKSFNLTEGISLQLTTEVLNRREELQCIIQGLQPQIRVGLSILDQFRQEQQIIKEHEKDLETNQNFVYSMNVIKQRKVDLSRGENVTNCVECNMTCHFPCYITCNINKDKCKAMAGSVQCSVCPGNCHWQKHVNNPYHFELYTEIKNKTSEELKIRYENAASKKSNSEQILAGLDRDLKTMSSAVVVMISRAKDIIQRLDEIAFRRSPLSEVDYIDLLIKSEKQEQKEGWIGRVRALDGVRKEAEMLSKIKDDENLSQKQCDAGAILSKYIQKLLI